MFKRIAEKFCACLLLVTTLFAGATAQAAQGLMFDLNTLPDPTAPLNVIDPSQFVVVDEGPAQEEIDEAINSYKLNSVLVRGNNSIAVINQKRLRVGEAIGIATVKTITNDGVTLEIGGEVRELRFYTGSMKTLSSGEEK